MKTAPKSLELADGKYEVVGQQVLRHGQPWREIAEDKFVQSLIDALEDARSSVDFYKRRVDLMQVCQSKMREPERTMACDIIANGQLLERPMAGSRYSVPDDYALGRAQTLRETLALVAAGVSQEELQVTLKARLTQFSSADTSATRQGTA